MNNAEQKLFFQQCLYTALIKLMQEKNFEKISIEELCKTAGVSRMTYYRSYNKKEDILMQHLEECFETYMERLRTAHKKSPYEIALSFFEFWQGEEKLFLSSVVHSGLSSQLMNRFYEYLEQVYSLMEFETPVEPFVSSFLAGGLYKMLIDQMKNGEDTPIEEMALFLAKGSRALTGLKEELQP